MIETPGTHGDDWLPEICGTALSIGTYRNADECRGISIATWNSGVLIAYVSISTRFMSHTGISRNDRCHFTKWP